MERTEFRKKAVLPIVLAALQVLAVFALIFINFMAGGYSEGIFDIEDTLFDGLSSLHNMSEYDRCIEAGQTYSFLAMLVVGGILLVIFFVTKAGKNHPMGAGARIGWLVGANTLFLFMGFLLFMYQFQGLTRVVLYPALMVAAAIYIYVAAKNARPGTGALLLQAAAFLAAFWLMWFVAPIVGWLFSVLGDIFTFLLILVVTGGSAYGSRRVRVVFI